MRWAMNCGWCSATRRRNDAIAFSKGQACVPETLGPAPYLGPIRTIRDRLESPVNLPSILAPEREAGGWPLIGYFPCGLAAARHPPRAVTMRVLDYGRARGCGAAEITGSILRSEPG